MAGLIVVDVIHVVTQLGGCDIELCFGDIAKLPVEDQVDVVVVSAFRGNYRPTATSMIGALKRGLGIDVFKLAGDKAEDLRDIHHCWWSQRLPNNLPFKRLMCFEAKHAGFSRPQELVGDVFRCLIPILNNQDGSVITPLLNTGDQGHSKPKMMVGMVEAAVNWMKVGLPLRKLKIVLYAATVADKEALLKKNKQICELFEELKGKYGMKELAEKNVAIKYDVYLSSSKEDDDLSTIIKEKLKLAKPDIRIFGNKQELNKDEVWQEDMYEVMIRCARVITVLTPQYLRSVSCMEQYNMALCCNRTSERDMLAPFYAEPIDNMPTYMGLVQYVDCLVNNSEKISTACLQLSSTLDVKVHAEVVYKRPKLEYDVFISYCHRNANKAAEVMEQVKALGENLKVFFDTEELKTGATWQQMLYDAIDGTKCFVAIVTNEYLKSPVCQEEFNLSLTKHCQQSDNLIMVPLLVDDDLVDLPLEFKQIQLVKATGKYFAPAIQSTCTAILQHLTGQKTNMQSLFTKPDVSSDTQKCQEQLRRARLNVRYSITANWSKTKFPPDLETYYMKYEQLAKNDDTQDEMKKENDETVDKSTGLSETKDDVKEKSAGLPNVEESLKEEKGINLDEENGTKKDEIKSEMKDDPKEENGKSVVKENEQIKCDVAISCTKHDIKHATFFIKMLKVFAPNLVIGCNDCSDQEKRSVLENASKIVAFISPNYTESPPHMEELNIALCRHRFSPKPILFAVQLHLLPKLPSYLHLIPYRCCHIDEIWKQIVNKIESQGAETHELILVTRYLMNRYERVSVEAAMGLTVAAGEFIQDIKNERTSTESTSPRSVLGNLARFEAELNVLQKTQVNEPVLTKMLYIVKLPKKVKHEEKKKVKDVAESNVNNSRRSSEEMNESNSKISGTEVTESDVDNIKRRSEEMNESNSKRSDTEVTESDVDNIKRRSREYKTEDKSKNVSRTSCNIL